MKNFTVLSITTPSVSDNRSDGYFLLKFSYTKRSWFSSKQVTEELLIKVVDNYNIRILGGGSFSESVMQKIFVALAKD